MAEIDTTIEARFTELLATGKQLVDQFDGDYVIDWKERSECIA